MTQYNPQQVSFRELWKIYHSELYFFLILGAFIAFCHWASFLIPVDLYERTLTPILHGGLIAVCFTGTWLLLTHADGLRVRRFYAYTLLVWGLADVSIVVQGYMFGIPIVNVGEDTFTSYELLVGNIFGWLMLVYPTEALRPGWLNLKRAAWQLLPMIGLVIFDAFIPTDLRFVIALYPLVLFVLVVMHLHAYRMWCEDNYSSMDHIDVQWIVRYLLMTLLMGLNYAYMCFTDNPNRLFAQSVLVFIVYTYSIGEILFRRDPWEGVSVSVTDNEETEHSTDENAEYREKLEAWMATEKPYLNKDFRLVDLMQVLPLNRTYLSNFIHAEYNCTFYQFVTNYRIEEAKRLMHEHPEMKLQEIAEQSGFSSATVFSRIFSRETGKTPTEWIANNR